LLAFQVFAGDRWLRIAVWSAPRISGDGGLYQGQGRRPGRINPNSDWERAGPVPAARYEPTLLLGRKAHVANLPELYNGPSFVLIFPVSQNFYMGRPGRYFQPFWV
jgi:hypothetical protein